MKEKIERYLPLWENKIKEEWDILLTSKSKEEREESRDTILELYRKEIKRIIQIHIGDRDKI
jgi:uncharacterized protein involved in tolerance to divalent cations